MIGYPSIKEISISKDRIALIKNQEDLVNNPDDSVAIQKVEEITEKLESRASSAEDMVQISKSNLLLGRNDEAVLFAEKALAKDSSNQKAKDLKELVSAQKRMDEQVRRQPVRTRESIRLDTIINEVKVVDELNNLKPFLIQRSRDNHFN